MRHVFEVSDGEYHAIEVAARERGQAPEDLFASWVAAVTKRVLGQEVDPHQAWFWTREWQAKEHEADEDVAAGRGTFYDFPEAFLDALYSSSSACQRSFAPSRFSMTGMPSHLSRRPSSRPRSGTW